MRKSQVQQVFIYLMVILVVGALLLVGYRSIINILDRGEEVELVRLKSDLLRDLSRTTSHGSVRDVEYRSNYISSVCFANNDEGQAHDSAATDIIGTELSLDDHNNIFLFDDNILIDALRFDNLYAGQNITCAESSVGSISFVMLGHRGEVVISVDE